MSLPTPERHEDGDILKSLEINLERFDFNGVDLTHIFRNTIREMGWTK